jgi:two-component system chemotaxis response regulator CheB
MITEAPVTERLSSAGLKVRALIVDDSLVMRRLLTTILSSIDGVTVVGAAQDGVEAMEKLAQLKPDLVTLDVEMPGPNGIETMRRIRREFPAVKVIMCSSLTARGAAVTIDALLAGADDFVTKQSSGHLTTSAYSSLQDELAQVVKRIYTARTPAAPRALPVAEAVERPTVALSAKRGLRAEVLAIGVSTGGPALLTEILPQLPADLGVPVLIVQHMPPFFTQILAERLDKICQLRTYEAKDGMEVKAGTILLAPGDFHMSLKRRGEGVFVRLNQNERENSCRPAVDVLFRSVAETYGAASVAAVLTGMGEDGMRGARVLREKGATVIAQDQQSSVVWGMPGAVVNAGLATSVHPASQIIPTLLRSL